MATSQNEDENKVLDGSLDENVLHVERTSSVNIQLSIHIDFFFKHFIILLLQYRVLEIFWQVFPNRNRMIKSIWMSTMTLTS